MIHQYVRYFSSPAGKKRIHIILVAKCCKEIEMVQGFYFLLYLKMKIIYLKLYHYYAFKI